MSDPPGCAVRVRVSATSANLGPGFDTLGLCLTLRDEVVVRRSAGGVSVRVSGEGAARVPRDATHLIAQAATAAFQRMGEAVPGLVLESTNRIPHGRGLGSSAAAIVAGVLAARAIVPDGDERMPDAAALGLAAEMEGHPDNVAACLLGGLTIAWTGPGGPRAVRLDPHPDVVPLVVVPGTKMSTQAARALLPKVVPHDAAAANAGRAALLVTALTSRPDLLFEATEDRIHQDYREPGMPETVALVNALRREGLAAAVSGAGPAVIVLAGRSEVDAATAVTGVEVPGGWHLRRLEIDRLGAGVEQLR